MCCDLNDENMFLHLFCIKKIKFKCIIGRSDIMCWCKNVSHVWCILLEGWYCPIPLLRTFPKCNTAQPWKSADNRIIWRSSAPKLLLSFSFMYYFNNFNNQEGKKKWQKAHIHATCASWSFRNQNKIYFLLKPKKRWPGRLTAFTTP